MADRRAGRGDDDDLDGGAGAFCEAGGGLPAQTRGSAVSLLVSSSPCDPSEGAGDGGRTSRREEAGDGGCTSRREEAGDGGRTSSPSQAVVDDVVSSSAELHTAEILAGGEDITRSSRREDWSDMVHEGLVVVFRYLTVRERIVVGAVCKSWHRASLDPGCWREADLNALPLWLEESKSSFFDVVLRRSAGQLRKLSAEQYPGKCLDRIWRECPLLEELRFPRSTCFIEEAPLQQLSSGLLSRLRVLKLNRLDIVQSSGYGDNKDVKTQVPTAEDSLVIAIARGCPQLVSLALNGDYTSFTDSAVEAIVEHLPRLERLGLTGSMITDASLALIGAKLKRLRKLRAFYCRDITEEGVSALKSSRKDLRVLASPWGPFDSDNSEGSDLDLEDWDEDYDEFMDGAEVDNDYSYYDGGIGDDGDDDDDDDDGDGDDDDDERGW